MSHLTPIGRTPEGLESRSELASSPRKDDHRGLILDFPVELVLNIARHLPATADVFRLSRVSKSLNRLLPMMLFDHARIDAEAYEEFETHPFLTPPSLLYVAIRAGAALPLVEAIIQGYRSRADRYGMQKLVGYHHHTYEPNLHLAVRLGRRDVVRALLENGVDVNTRWYDWLWLVGEEFTGKPCGPHTECWLCEWSCKDVLDVCREVMDEDMAEYLLGAGFKPVRPPEFLAMWT